VHVPTWHDHEHTHDDGHHVHAHADGFAGRHSHRHEHGRFVVQAFIAYWLSERFSASVEVIAVVFFAVGVLQTVSFLCAPAVARGYGLLHALSQMDVPTRQAYVMALVEPDERTPAAAYSNTARYVVRPTGPLLAGAASSVWLGLPSVAADQRRLRPDPVAMVPHRAARRRGTTACGRPQC
jgi:hypothetical protein